MIVAAGSSDAALAFVEIGALVFALALLSRLAGRFGLTAIPLYLLAGLAMGEGGFVQLDVTLEFFEIAAEIGVLLLLFTLGLEYSESELRSGLRSGLRPGVVDMTLQCPPRCCARADPRVGAAGGGAAGRRHVDHLVRGGSKVLSDLGRLGFRETPAVLNILVIEDLAMAVYLPVVAALIVGGSLVGTMTSVAVALIVVTIILLAALRYGRRLSDLVAGGSTRPSC